MKQRLQALLSLQREPAERQLVDDRRSHGFGSWQVYGGTSYTYRYGDISIDRRGNPNFTRSDSFSTQSDLLSRVDMTARSHTENWGIETRFSGGYLWDYYDDKDAGGRHGNEVLLSSASLELTHLATETTAQSAAGERHPSIQSAFL